MYEFKMPSLGADMVEGTLTSWNVEVGDAIERGEIICEVETNKGDIDVEVWESGVVEELRVEPGQKIPVGEVIAVLDKGEEIAQEEEKTEDKREREEKEKEKSEKPTKAPRDPADLRVPEGVVASPAARRRAAELGVELQGLQGTGLQGAVTVADVERAHQPTQEVSQEVAEEVAKEPPKPRISPVARRLAEREGVDLAEVLGSGPRGAIRREDVEKALAEREPSEGREPEKDEPEAMAAMREAIAAAMARSKSEIPHYYLHETVPMHRATEWLRDYNADRPAGERLLMGVLFIKAVALACREIPEMNGVFEDGQFEPREGINPGFAISLRRGGVIPPAIHDADKKALPELMDHLRDLTRRVRRGKLRSSEVTDATITITSLGERGVEAVYGVIYPPQVAIVGFGKVTDRFWADDELVSTRPAMTMTLSADHRVSDGIAGARFLSLISDLLQRPEKL